MSDSLYPDEAFGTLIAKYNEYAALTRLTPDPAIVVTDQTLPEFFAPVPVLYSDTFSR